MDEIDVTVGINLRRDEQRTRSLPSKDPICYVPLSEPNANIQITAIGYSRSTSCVVKNLPYECLFNIHIKPSGLENLISRGQQKQTEA